jgi:hypothetical protein
MLQKRPAPRLKASLEQIGAWLLDQPLAPSLEGQCCDRLRPNQVRHELLQSLKKNELGLENLVDWRWDARQRQAKGWLWQAGALQRFRWSRQSGRLTLHEQLRCSAMAPLQALV